MAKPTKKTDLETKPDTPKAAPDDAKVEDAVERPEPEATDVPAEDGLAEPAAEEEPVKAPVEGPETVTVAPKPRRGGFLGGLTGGVLAAVIGFGAAQYLGDGWPFSSTGQSDETTAQLAAQGAKLDDLGAKLTALDGKVATPATPDISGPINAVESKINGRIDSLSGQFGGITARLDALEARLSALEKRPAGSARDMSGVVSAYEKELEAMRNELAAQRAHNEEIAAKVAKAADTATAEIGAAAGQAKAMEARAAMLRIHAALETGGSFDSALAAIKDVTIPAGLRDVAAKGAPTLADLQAGFAEPARAAIAASLRADAGASATDRVSAFLRTQLGARSLAPREGNDPDAILSRAEAALAKGALTEALSEIATLPAPGQAEMAAWVALARQRADALAAAQTLSASLPLN